MQGAKWWLVCYDVRDPERLRKAAKHMEGYGERMQYSVFRVWLAPREAERLRWELTEMLTPEDDVLMIPLCSGCVEGIRSTHLDGQRPLWPGEPERYTVI